jgi:hypothetical protein
MLGAPCFFPHSTTQTPTNVPGAFLLTQTFVFAYMLSTDISAHPSLAHKGLAGLDLTSTLQDASSDQGMRGSAEKAAKL